VCALQSAPERGSPSPPPWFPLGEGLREVDKDPDDAGAPPDRPADFVGAMCTGSTRPREDENSQRVAWRLTGLARLDRA